MPKVKTDSVTWHLTRDGKDVIVSLPAEGPGVIGDASFRVRRGDMFMGVSFEALRAAAPGEFRPLKIP